MEQLPTLAELEEILLVKQQEEQSFILEEQERQRKEQEKEKQQINVIRELIERIILQLIRYDINVYMTVLARGQQWDKFNKNRYNEYDTYFYYTDFKDNKQLQQTYNSGYYGSFKNIMGYNRLFHEYFTKAVDQICNDVKKQKGYKALGYECSDSGMKFMFSMK